MTRRHGPWHPRRGGPCWLRKTFTLVLTILALLAFASSATAQAASSVIPTPSAERGTGSATSIAPSTTSGTLDATLAPVKLVESQVVSASLDVNASKPAQFYLDLPFKNASNPLYITATLCDGPEIPAYDVYNTTLLKHLDRSSIEATVSTLVRIYLSIDQENKSPGPNALQAEPDIEYFTGGLATVEDTYREPDGAWISVWPPEDTRNVTGTWHFILAASTEGPPLSLMGTQGLIFDDSDDERALVTTYNATQGTSENLTVALLPTQGPGSLLRAGYFNSSVCAIAQAFSLFNSSTSDVRPRFNRSLTKRGEQYSDANATRVQWEISNLQPGTNYTAWLIDSSNYGSSGAKSTIMWPAIKFVTKRSSACRLVYDLEFCPEVAYSIPVGRGVSTDHALRVINDTVWPNFANFSTTIDTFPCGSEEFGQYSPVQTCDSCKLAYRDWLCAVTMPRCVDPLPSLDNETTAAVPNVLDMTGTSTPLNTGLLPYIINRRNNSRQTYIEAQDGLDAPTYGELLPCIYTCYFVSRHCPQPLIEWYCPLWDITAQGIYGTFADAGEMGIGGGYNDGAGEDRQRWGGPTRYIAQDAFGNLFCNSLGVDRILLATNGASPLGPSMLAMLQGTTLLATAIIMLG